MYVALCNLLFPLTIMYLRFMQVDRYSTSSFLLTAVAILLYEQITSHPSPLLRDLYAPCCFSAPKQ